MLGWTWREAPDPTGSINRTLLIGSMCGKIDNIRGVAQPG